MININDKILSILRIGISIISSKILYNCNLLIAMITIDGLISAFSWLSSFFDKNIKYTYVDNHAQIYTNSVIDRYISYLILYIGYIVTKTFVWTYDIPFLYLILSLVPLPEIINKFISSSIYKKINNIKQHIIKKIIAKNIVVGIKNLSNTYINKHIELKYNEIMPLLSNYNNAIDIVYDFGKNIVLVLLVSYIRKYTSKFYYNIAKMIISYKYGDKLDSFNVNGARAKLIKIIDNKKWDNLIKPSFIKIILCIYEDHENNSDCLKKIISKFSILFSASLAMWTLCAFFNTSIIAPIISIIMLLYRKEHGVELYKKSFILGPVFILSIIYNNPIIISFLSQFGYYIIFNKLSLSITKSILKNFYKIINKIITINKQYNNLILLSLPYAFIVKMIKINNVFVGTFITSVIFNIISNNDTKYNLIYTCIVITSIISQSSFHIIYNAIIVYILAAFLNKNILYTIRDSIIDSIKYCINNLKNFCINNNSYIIPNKINIDNIIDSVNNLNSVNDINISHKNTSFHKNINDKYIDPVIFTLPNEQFINAILIKEQQTIVYDDTCDTCFNIIDNYHNTE
jgi:hypothetical protein